MFFGRSHPMIIEQVQEISVAYQQGHNKHATVSVSGMLVASVNWSNGYKFLEMYSELHPSSKAREQKKNKYLAVIPVLYERF